MSFFQKRFSILHAPPRTETTPEHRDSRSHDRIAMSRKIKPHNLPRSLREAAWFCWRHYPPAQDWGRQLLWTWIGWHSTNDGIAIVRADNEEVIGVGCARPVMKSADASDCYAFDPEGSYLYVDIAVTSEPGAFYVLFLIMLKRFGYRPKIAYKRYPKPEIIERTLEDMRRHLVREAKIYGR